MKYWLTIGVLAMLFRSFGWDYFAPQDMNNDFFWAVHRIMSSVCILVFLKAGAYGRSLNDRLIMDFVLAFIWADVAHRIGCAYVIHENLERIKNATPTLVWEDWFIAPIWGLFQLLATVKHKNNIFYNPRFYDAGAKN